MRDEEEQLIANLEHEVSVLTSKLALANRMLEAANQSITELHTALEASDIRITQYEELEPELNERIAQLEAELREGLEMWLENYLECSWTKSARAALEGKAT